MKISWHGHSCVRINTISNYKIIIDPFVSGNDFSDLDLKTLKVDTIILTHAHKDHVGDTIEIAKRNNANVIAIVELADELATHGISTHGMNIGGSYKTAFGSVKFVPAIHSSTYEGKPMGLAAGVLISDDISTVYHCGDTALFSDMSLVPHSNVCFIPIGDNFTMGIDDAVKAATIIDSDLFIPIHYDTFPVIEQNPYEFTNKLPQVNGLVPDIGEEIEV